MRNQPISEVPRREVDHHNNPSPDKYVGSKRLGEAGDDRTRLSFADIHAEFEQAVFFRHLFPSDDEADT